VQCIDTAKHNIVAALKWTRFFTPVQEANTIIISPRSTDVAGGYSPSVLDEMRTALHASRALRLNLTRDLPADYTALTLTEGFYMATMGGAEGMHMQPSS